MTGPSHFVLQKLRRLIELAYGDYLVMEYVRWSPQQTGDGTITAAPAEVAIIYDQMWRKPL